MDLVEIRKKTNRLLNAFDSVKTQLKAEEKNEQEATIRLQDINEAQVIVQHIAQLVQQQAHERIEGVVSKCLAAVFGDMYGFKIRFDRKRGKTEASLLLLRDGHEIENVLDSDSGGVVDVAALALRLSCIVLSKPTLKRVMILDEPFRNLDLKNRENIRILLEELSLDFGVQFLIVTHEIAFQTGKVIEL